MPSSITLTVSSLPASTSFFLSALQPLNYVYRGRTGNVIGFGLPDAAPDFWLCQESPGVPAGAAHVAFPAASQQKVQEFFVSALKAGGKCRGEPLLRDPESGYYSAAVIDFDGNSIEAVHRPDLVLDSSDESRPSSTTSVNSNESKPAMSSRAAPTVVSKATTAKSAAPSSTSKAPTAASKAPTQASKAPTQASRSPTHVSKAPTQASRSPTQVSKAPTQASRAPTYAPTQALPGQTVVATAPNGEVVTNFISEARGMISGAREIVNQVRPALDSSNSAPNVHRSGSDPQSHQPSDTIVGTLLGVAAGAALGYAYHKATGSDSNGRRPSLSRTQTDPHYGNNEKFQYYEYVHQSPYAIEAAPSEYSRAPSGTQRYITMQDAESIAPSERASTIRPRRRSSFSEFASRASQAKSTALKLLEAPPTSYRAPTVITQTSRRSSRHLSDEDLRSSVRSHASRRSSGTKSHHTSRAPSAHGSDRTVVPASSSRSKAPGGSGGGNSSSTVSRSSSKTTLRRDAADYPLPPSRAGTWAPGGNGGRGSSDAGTAFFSSASKAKTSASKMSTPPLSRAALDKLRERERAGGRSELTKSVVGKVEDVTKLDLPDEEVAPSDSVSQISSSAGSRRSRKSRR